jgi:hypothetical protein
MLKKPIKYYLIIRPYLQSDGVEAPQTVNSSNAYGNPLIWMRLQP